MRIFFVDLETTGLVARSHVILECAVVVTEESLEPIYSASTLVHNEKLPDAIDPFVVDMHTKNGLWEDLSTKPSLPVEFLSTWLSNIADATGCSKGPEYSGAPLGGSTINFDRDFLGVHAPGFLSKISHRNIDVSTVHALGVMLFDTHHSDEVTTAHRALPDVQFSIERLKWYVRRHFNPHGRK